MKAGRGGRRSARHLPAAAETKRGETSQTGHKIPPRVGSRNGPKISPSITRSRHKKKTFTKWEIISWKTRKKTNEKKCSPPLAHFLPNWDEGRGRKKREEEEEEEEKASSCGIIGVDCDIHHEDVTDPAFTRAIQTHSIIDWLVIIGRWFLCKLARRIILKLLWPFAPVWCKWGAMRRNEAPSFFQESVSHVSGWEVGWWVAPETPQDELSLDDD